ncbi:MAG: polysaccharide deacetylase family protein [Pseudomonadota bacterium]|nr:polysaccharide deacetylase family protein [Pseudomonadota bacterium]
MSTAIASLTPLDGTVALTFDDGPSPTDTPKVLAILKKYNVKATFFVMGYAAKKHPELIKQILAEGHTLGLHSMSHPDLTKSTDTELQFEVVEPKNILKSIIGKDAVCVRPPYGAIDERVAEYIESQKMAPIMLGLNSFDFERLPAKKIAAWVIKKIQPGMMVLMHDGASDRDQTVVALPLIIEGIQRKGIGFSAICQFGNG